MDVPARTAEAIVKIEMAEGGVEIVAPEQAHDPAAEPDALGIAGRSADRPGGFLEFVDFFLVLGLVASFLLLFLAGFWIGPLGRCGRRMANQEGRTERDT